MVEGCLRKSLAGQSQPRTIAAEEFLLGHLPRLLNRSGDGQEADARPPSASSQAAASDRLESRRNGHVFPIFFFSCINTDMLIILFYAVFVVVVRAWVCLQWNVLQRVFFNVQYLLSNRGTFSFVFSFINSDLLILLFYAVFVVLARAWVCLQWMLLQFFFNCICRHTGVRFLFFCNGLRQIIVIVFRCCSLS